MNLHLLLRQRHTRTVGISTLLARLVPMIFIAALTACGGSSSSGGGGGGGGGSTATVTGTAAGGAPIAGATVTLKDAAGNSKTATTGSDGTFSIDVSGLTAPFLLSVAATSSTYYGFASASNTTANLTPYTSVVLQSYYAAQGSTADAVFGGTLTSDSFPTANQLNILAGSVVTILQPYLGNAGVSDPTSFDLFTTTFTADGTGFDQVLDHTQVSSATDFSVDNGSVVGTAGPVSSTVTVTTAAGSGANPGSVTFTTNTSDGGGNTSSSQQTDPVGTPAQQSDLDTALNGVLTMFSNLITAGRSSSFSTTDADAFIDPNYLDEGKIRSQFDTDLVSFFTQEVPAGATVTASIARVNSFTDTSATDQTLNVTVKLAVTSSGTTTYQYVAEGDNLNDGNVYHLNGSGQWVFYGHQSIAKTHVMLEANRFYDPSTAPAGTTDLQIQAQVSDAQGLLIGVGLAGGSNSLPDCSSYTSGANQPMTLASLTLMKDTGTFNGSEDRYDLPCTTQPGFSAPVPIDSSTAPAAGTVYTFTLSKTAGGTTTQTSILNSVTTELIDITQINGVSRANFVASNTASQVAGTQLSITFSAPTTFPVLYYTLNAYCQNANEASNGGGSDIQGDLSNIPVGTTTGTITIPQQCDNAAIARLGVSANAWGVNGEHSFVTQNLSP